MSGALFNGSKFTVSYRCLDDSWIYSARGKHLSDKPSVGKPAARHQAIPACGGVSNLQLYSSC